MFSDDVFIYVYDFLPSRKNTEKRNEIHLHTDEANAFKYLTKNLPIDTAINKAGTPKAIEKQSFSPKHLTSSLRIGVSTVEMSDPELMLK